MIYASLILNILVLFPVSFGLLADRPQMVPVFGHRTTARDILLFVYLTILIVSIGVLITGPVLSPYVNSLLLGQITYKFLSVFFIRNKKNPVLWFNAGIAVFHVGTLLFSFGTT